MPRNQTPDSRIFHSSRNFPFGRSFDREIRTDFWKFRRFNGPRLLRVYARAMRLENLGFETKVPGAPMTNILVGFPVIPMIQMTPVIREDRRGNEVRRSLRRRGRWCRSRDERSESYRIMRRMGGNLLPGVVSRHPLRGIEGIVARLYNR